jgi:rhodanese-related sulfurtransferase
MLKNFKFIVVFLIFSALACSQTDKKPNNDSKTKEKKPVVKEVNAKDFKELLDKGGAILIDVREPMELKSDGYIPNSLNVPAYRINELWNQKVKADKDAVILTYCLSGYRSNVASEELIEMGYTNVYSLKGGISAWKANKYNIVK